MISRRASRPPYPGRTAGLLLLSALASLVPPGSASIAGQPAFVEWRSEEGGIRLEMPAGWRAEETLTGTSYKAVLGPDPNVTDPAKLQVELVIRRDRRAGALFPFGSDDFDRGSVTFAKDLASKATQKGTTNMTHFDNSISGMKSRQFFVSAGMYSDECTQLWVSLGLRHEEGFLAVAKTPCTQKGTRFLNVPEGSRENDIAEIARSLEVDAVWGKKGK